MKEKNSFRFNRIRELSIKLDRELLRFLDQRGFNNLNMPQAEGLWHYLKERSVRSDDWAQIFRRYTLWLRQSFPHSKLHVEATDGELVEREEKPDVPVRQDGPEPSGSVDQHANS